MFQWSAVYPLTVAYLHANYGQCVQTLYAYVDCGCFKLQIASEGLKHRVFEVSLADLQGDEDHSFRKIRLRAEDVQGKNVLTNFWV